MKFFLFVLLACIPNNIIADLEVSSCVSLPTPPCLICFVLQPSYSEEVYYAPVHQKTLAHFLFSFSAPANASDIGAFPINIFNIINTYGVRHLHLSLTRGRLYGKVSHQLPTAPPGMVCRITLKEDDALSIHPLIRSLSGLTSASISDAFTHGTVSRPHIGWVGGGRPMSGKKQYVLHAPQESVCNENLRSWTELLPCSSNQGILSLLPNDIEVFMSSQYVSLGLEFGVACEGKDRAVTERQIYLNVSLSILLPDFFFPSLGSLPECPVESHSTDSAAAVVHRVVEDDFEHQSLVVERHVSSDSVSRGRLLLAVQYETPEKHALLHITQVVPWTAPPLLHTLRLAHNSFDIPLDQSSDVVVWHYVVPAKRGESPALIELMLQPFTKSGNFTVEVIFEKSMLGITEYPADPSRGVDIPAATATLVPAACADDNHPAPRHHGPSSRCPILQRHTLGGLAQLPVPDFSMYFNVVCFSLMPVAFLFGGALQALYPTASQGDDTAAHPTEYAKAGRFKKVRRAVAMIVMAAGLALYMDRSLQRHAERAIATVQSALIKDEL